jgi:hypothetical protein
MSLVSKIKEVMKQELEDNPNLTDKEYEELFVKYYMYYMEQESRTRSKGKSKFLWAPENLPKWTSK